MLFEELFIPSFLRNISKLFVPNAFKFQTPFDVQGVQLKAETRSMESLMNLLFPDITYIQGARGGGICQASGKCSLR